MITFKITRHTLLYIYRRFINEGFSYRASALAFTSLLTIVPFLFVIFYILNIFPAFTDITVIGKNYILQNFIPTAADKVEYYLLGFIKSANQLPKIDILLLFFSVTILVYTIEETLCDIWKVPNRSKINYIFVIYWVIFLFLPFIIGMSVFVTSSFLSLPWVKNVTTTLGITHVVIFNLPLLINTLIFMLLYKFIPNTHIKFRYSLFGGFVAAGLFEIARIVFAFYVTRFPSYALIYGAFATIPIFLIWLYIFWLIILFSGFLTYALFEKKIK